MLLSSTPHPHRNFYYQGFLRDHEQPIGNWQLSVQLAEMIKITIVGKRCRLRCDDSLLRILLKTEKKLLSTGLHHLPLCYQDYNCLPFLLQKKFFFDACYESGEMLRSVEMWPSTFYNCACHLQVLYSIALGQQCTAASKVVSPINNSLVSSIHIGINPK